MSDKELSRAKSTRQQWTMSEWDYKKKQLFRTQLLVTRERFSRFMITQTSKPKTASTFGQYVREINDYYQSPKNRTTIAFKMQKNKSQNALPSLL